MICTPNLIILIKTKETIRYYELLGHGDKTLSIDVTNNLTHVSVPVKDE
jgi:hypothetical protein